jgi:predicted HNH restriction endonuclease
MWLRGNEKRRSNDIVTVMNECGAYCYSCGNTYEETAQKLGLGFAVHHTRPFADHGERYKKIPLCALCHEVITALQRTMRRVMERGDAS